MNTDYVRYLCDACARDDLKEDEAQTGPSGLTLCPECLADEVAEGDSEDPVEYE